MALSKKLEDRLSTTLKRFQSILSTARARDVNESDTVVIVTDLLAEMFGFDKYTEITSEYAIRGTYCDLALKVEDKLQLLTEVKAIGLDLKDAHIKQALDYGVNLGVEWVALTNGVIWKIYRVIYGQPIESEEVLTLDLLSLNPRNLSHLELLYPMTREGIVKGALPDHYAQRQARNKFLLAALLLSDPVLDTLRRELRRLQPDIRITNEDLSEELEREVFKREVVEGPKASEARKSLQKAATKALRAVKKTQKVNTINVTESDVPLHDILETLEADSQSISDSTLIQ